MGMLDSAFRHGHTDPDDARLNAPEPKKTGRAPKADLTAEVLAELKLMRETMSNLAAHQRSQIANGVLEVATWKLDADGVLVRSFQTQVGSIIVTNATGAAVTVQAGTAGGSTAPDVGRGVQVIPDGAWLAIPVGSHAFTVYGTAGTSVGVQAFTGLQAFGAA